MSGYPRFFKFSVTRVKRTARFRRVTFSHLVNIHPKTSHSGDLTPSIHQLRRTIAMLALGALCAGSAIAQNDWCKSKWGPNDEIGATNLLTPQLAADAAKLVKTGKTYALGFETNSSTPAFAPRTWALTILQPGQVGGISLGGTKTTYNDDIYMGWVGTGSQLDGLGHIGIDNVYYNCNKNSDFVQANGLKKLGIEKVPPFVTRGVVLDMTEHFKTPMLPEGTAFNRKEIEEQATRQGITIKKGDVDCSTRAGKHWRARTTSASSPRNPVLARTAHFFWRLKRSLPWAQITGDWKLCRSKKMSAYSKYTKSCWQGMASTFLRT